MAYFRKRGNKWQYRIMYTDPITNKRTEVSKGGFDSKPEAKHAAIEHEAKLLSGQAVVSNDELLKYYLKEWLKDFKKDNVRKNTYILHERNVDKHIIPYFKDIKLKNVTSQQYQKFLNYLADKDYSKRTIEIVHGTMFDAMKTAVKPLRKIVDNPCEGVTIPKKTEKKKGSLQYIDSEDIPKFLTMAKRDNYLYWIFFKTLIFTGMRKGEAAALQRKDIDLKNGYISINKSLDFQARNEDELFGDTKTYHSERTIKINESLRKDLIKHMDWLNDNRITFNDIYRHDLDLVFCRQDGNIIPKSTLFNALNRICKKADIEKLPIHALRHTHAVLALEQGDDMKVIQERLGHGSYQITADVYSHVSKRLEQKSMDNLENFAKNID
ncbi:tyrosine-type recombinase/integrase [Tenuibacillus multivorans]|uniref:Site-specific recombinase XerD n=1 Tax=Tenuibacillus multivorans TaxID=237069 RepID=A0A1G9XSI1_9BACI|nr:tyrosine-type recombinase/integrase [Tenuibacillus multivorans]GEL75791.1 site-specific integrase [Tenuibacillus multivorans]SDM99471.1 Site-specific recombinase XerD [Tenuibacillus multivorans]